MIEDQVLFQELAAAYAAKYLELRGADAPAEAYSWISDYLDRFLHTDPAEPLRLASVILSDLSDPFRRPEERGPLIADVLGLLYDSYRACFRFREFEALTRVVDADGP